MLLTPYIEMALAFKLLEDSEQGRTLLRVTCSCPMQVMKGQKNITLHEAWSIRHNRSLLMLGFPKG